MKEILEKTVIEHDLVSKTFMNFWECPKIVLIGIGALI